MTSMLAHKKLWDFATNGPNETCPYAHSWILPDVTTQDEFYWMAYQDMHAVWAQESEETNLMFCLFMALWFADQYQERNGPIPVECVNQFTNLIEV